MFPPGCHPRVPPPSDPLKSCLQPAPLSSLLSSYVSPDDVCPGPSPSETRSHQVIQRSFLTYADDRRCAGGQASRKNGVPDVTNAKLVSKSENAAIARVMRVSTQGIAKILRPSFCS